MRISFLFFMNRVCIYVMKTLILSVVFGVLSLASQISGFSTSVLQPEKFDLLTETIGSE